MEREKERIYTNKEIVKGLFIIFSIWLVSVFLHYSHEQGILGSVFEMSVLFLAFNLIVVEKFYYTSIAFLLAATYLGVWFTPVWLLLDGILFKKTLYTAVSIVIQKMTGSELIPEGTEGEWYKDMCNDLKEIEELEQEAWKEALEDIQQIQDHVVDMASGYEYNIVRLLAAKAIVLEFALERLMCERHDNKLWRKIIKGLRFLATKGRSIGLGEADECCGMLSKRVVQRLQNMLERMHEETMERFMESMASDEVSKWLEVLLQTAEEIVVYQKQEAEILEKYLAKKEMIRKCREVLVKTLKKEGRNLSGSDLLGQADSKEDRGMILDGEMSVWHHKQEDEIRAWCQKWNLKL